jgi:predicted amidohydrolase YtcJ
MFNGLPADAVFYNGHILSQAPGQVDVTGLAVRDGRIAFTGANADALALAGPETQRVDLNGKTVVPGFCDSHLHFIMYGLGLASTADLASSGDMDALLGTLANHRDTTPFEWILGRGFDQSKLRENRFPTREDLDRVSRTRPILIVRICGHAAVANTAAITLLSDAERGAGDPEAGLYTEEDIRPFRDRMPQTSPAEMEEAVLRAAEIALKSGITSIGTLIDTVDQIGAYQRLHRRGALPLRVTMMPPYSAVSALHEHGIATGFGNEWLKFGGAKFFSDGSLGARTALMAQPYADDPDNPQNLGIRIYEPHDLQKKAADAQEKGFQLVIHAIGDQANRESLDAIEHALGSQGDNGYHRHRIEHASVLPPDLLKRMADRKIVGVVQPQFVQSDIWTGERVGAARARGAYPFRTMRDAGIPLALSSDCPVEKLDAFACLDAAVNRAPWSPEERLTVEEAIHDYTYSSAYALHREKEIGTLDVGKLADFVVLSENPIGNERGLRDIKAEAVYVGGKRV